MGLAEDRRIFEEKLKTGKIKSTDLRDVRLVLMQPPAPSPNHSPDASRPDLIAQTNAARIWAHSSTNSDLARASDIIRDKLRVVSAFIVYLEKDLLEASPLDIMAWQDWLVRTRNLKARTIYNYSSHLSSFFEYLREIKVFSKFIKFNPVRAAFPKCPESYQTRSSRALSDKSLKDLWRVMEKVKRTRSVIALRDYAIFRFFAATGDRRAEIINLQGCDIELFKGGLIYYPRYKGGASSGNTINDKEVRHALLDYITASGRREREVFGLDVPVWLAHDRADEYRVDPENYVPRAFREFVSREALMRAAKRTGMTSRAFAFRMKVYAERAGIYNFHLHQFRHTFARIVAEETKSLAEVQNALKHKNVKTTRAYVQNIEIRADNHSGRMKKRIRRK
ncbi:MAG: tyrosine-type recombinase/integrase [Pyrinomonadaceae bacterium]